MTEQADYADSNKHKFWYSDPLTKSDRIGIALIGSLTLGWLAVLVCAYLLSEFSFTPTSVLMVFATGAILGLMLGIAFPKQAKYLIFPLLLFLLIT